MSAPAGKPTADRRTVTVGDVDVFLDRGKVAVTLTRAELAIVLNALHTVRQRRDTLERACPSMHDQAALDRAIDRTTRTAREQLQ